MSMSTYLFTSESVTEGHPDKIADQISDAVLDAIIADDKTARVACETLVTTGMAFVAGEITTSTYVHIPEIVRQTIKDIGYNDSSMGFDWETCAVLTSIDKQSPDIAIGVNPGEGLYEEQGAGDQGLMFGYACNETPELMPAPIMFAHRLGRKLTEIRKTGRVKWLRPDAKSQVSVEYVDGKPVAIRNVVISTQHTPEVSHAEIEKFCIEKVIKAVLPREMLRKTEYLVNPTGRFVTGGPQGDTGLTGRKIIVDSYGGMGRHGGGAFSGKDPTKVDRSAAYLGRWIAKNVVAAGLAEKCEVQFAYAIGYPDPVSVNVDTFGTAREDESAIVAAINRVFSFQPADIIEQLDLRRPIYKKTTNYGHFGKSDPDITWERTDKAGALKNALRRTVSMSRSCSRR